MLNPKIAEDIIDYALSKGANFAELFIENQETQNIQTITGKVQNIQTGIDFGIGIRLLFGQNVVYGYTNNTNREELLRITDLLTKRYISNQVASISPLNFIKQENKHPTINGLDNTIPTEEKINFLLSIDQASRSFEKIEQTQISSAQRLQKVEIFNSEGVHVTDNRHYSRIRARAIAINGNEQADGHSAPGALQGWEFSQNIDPHELGNQIAGQALTNLTAKACPAGKMPVIIDNGFGGVIFHEACGHLLETTSVAKKASVFHDKMGEMIASPIVSAVDDGTLKNEWGSINIDDEGMETQKTQLIKDGKLTSFLVDKVGSEQTGYKRTGSGRRQSYKFAPASRMRNTFIEPRDDNFEEMIASIPHGIYAKQMGGGSVNPGTGEFNFSTSECYLIKDGKIIHPVKGATLIGTGPEILKKISMISDNFSLAAGMCGSVSGSVPTTVGQAALKVDEILVGGNS